MPWVLVCAHLLCPEPCSESLTEKQGLRHTAWSDPDYNSGTESQRRQKTPALVPSLALRKLGSRLPLALTAFESAPYGRRPWAPGRARLPPRASGCHMGSCAARVAEDSRDSALRSTPLSPWLLLKPCCAGRPISTQVPQSETWGMTCLLARACDPQYRGPCTVSTARRQRGARMGTPWPSPLSPSHTPESKTGDQR